MLKEHSYSYSDEIEKDNKSERETRFRLFSLVVEGWRWFCWYHFQKEELKTIGCHIHVYSNHNELHNQLLGLLQIIHSVL